jgi:hypothetical protein
LIFIPRFSPGIKTPFPSHFLGWLLLNYLKPEHLGNGFRIWIQVAMEGGFAVVDGGAGVFKAITS